MDGHKVVSYTEGSFGYCSELWVQLSSYTEDTSCSTVLKYEIISCDDSKTPRLCGDPQVRWRLFLNFYVYRKGRRRVQNCGRLQMKRSLIPNLTPLIFDQNVVVLLFIGWNCCLYIPAVAPGRVGGVCVYIPGWVPARVWLLQLLLEAAPPGTVLPHPHALLLHCAGAIYLSSLHVNKVSISVVFGLAWCRKTEHIVIYIQRTIFAIRHVFVPPQVGSIRKCRHAQTRNHGLTFKIASTLGTAHDQTNITYGGQKSISPLEMGNNVFRMK